MLHRYLLPRIVATSVMLCLTTWALAMTRADADEESLRLLLPGQVFAVAGVKTNVYFDNIVLTRQPAAYKFEFASDLGNVEERRWTCTPTADQVGIHSIAVTVRDAEGSVVGRGSTRLHVVLSKSDNNEVVKILFVGDSLTHASAYPNEVARLLRQPGNPDWKMLGTHKPSSAAKDVVHEGYGGWTWQRFVTQYEPNPDGTYRKRSSPFVFLSNDGKPALNVERYFAESCNGERPDFVFFLLGINDCFSADPEDLEATDERIDGMLQHADTLLAAFRKAAPNAELAVCLTTPPNARESGFEANYKGRYHRWGWKRIQHRLVERLMAHVADRQGGQVFIAPTELNLDPFDGYPENNGVHPNGVGYRQIGASMYAWLKWRLADK
ncbi:MAG: hypothetical protein CMJ64_06625 [Planctomycetaceae bacterium]|nr:hypothetical protein [Planctomycetaceae bacterium]